MNVELTVQLGGENRTELLHFEETLSNVSLNVADIEGKPRGRPSARFAHFSCALL